MIKVYLDRNVDVRKLKNVAHGVCDKGSIEFTQWPLEGKNRRIQEYGLPAGNIAWSGLKHVSWSDLDFCAWDDFSPTNKYEQILSIVGKEHREDCIHFDIAIKNGCSFFFTSDKDFLQKKVELQSLSQIQIYDPDNTEDVAHFLMDIKNKAFH